MLVARVLRRRGHEVEAFDNAEAAWEAYQRERFPLLILDWFLPGMDGLELCRLIRALPDGDRSVILLVTAQDHPEALVAVLDAGASDFVAKPFTTDFLQVRLAIAERQVVEIAARKRAEEELARLAATDVLTGVANRRRSTEQLEQFLLMGRRRQESVALGLLDLDHFKQVNDRHGHAAGDQVLHAFGTLLLQTFRAEDVVGRWGGEEFVVGFYGASGRDLAERLEFVQTLLRRRTFANERGEGFQVTFSGGVAEHPRDGSTLGVIYRAADSALYQAKRAGRDRVTIAVQTAPDALTSTEPGDHRT